MQLLNACWLEDERAVQAQRRALMWPLIGVGLGIAALAWALCAWIRATERKDEEQHRRERAAEAKRLDALFNVRLSQHRPPPSARPPERAPVPRVYTSREAFEADVGPVPPGMLESEPVRIIAFGREDRPAAAVYSSPEEAKAATGFDFKPDVDAAGPSVFPQRHSLDLDPPPAPESSHAPHAPACDPTPSYDSGASHDAGCTTDAPGDI